MQRGNSHNFNSSCPLRVANMATADRVKAAQHLKRCGTQGPAAAVTLRAATQEQPSSRRSLNTPGTCSQPTTFCLSTALTEACLHGASGANPSKQAPSHSTLSPALTSLPMPDATPSPPAPRYVPT